MEIFSPVFNVLSPTIPLMGSRAKAGFPSPADDYIERSLNLHDQMVEHPASTFFVTVSGDSMKDAGIIHGDLLVVDRSIEASNGMVVMAILNGEFTVKYFYLTSRGIDLVPANPTYPKFHLSKEDDFEVWGVVTHAVHNLPK